MEPQKTLNWQRNLKRKKKAKKYHSKKNEILPLPAIQMDLKNVMLSEINQTEKRQIVHDITYTWNQKNNTNTCIKQN